MHGQTHPSTNCINPCDGVPFSVHTHAGLHYIYHQHNTQQSSEQNVMKVLHLFPTNPGCCLDGLTIF